MTKRKIPFPFPILLFLGAAVVEACFGKWEVVWIALLMSAGFSLLWYLIAGLVLLLWGDKKGPEPETPPPPGVLGDFWMGTWIATEDPKKKKRILLLARLSLPAAFFVFAGLMFFSDRMDLESTLLFFVWVLVGFGLMAFEIVKDLRAETQRRNRPPRIGQSMEAPAPLSPLEKRLRQLDEWREIGLIEREEYEKLKKQAEKGACDE